MSVAPHTHWRPADLAELQRLAEIGAKFAANHRRGRKVGVLAETVRALVERTRPRTFDDLLVELEFAALQGQHMGAGPILRVDRAWGIVLYVERGRECEATFKRVRNIAHLRKSRGPKSRESGA